MLCTLLDRFRALLSNFLTLVCNSFELVDDGVLIPWLPELIVEAEIWLALSELIVERLVAIARHSLVDLLAKLHDLVRVSAKDEQNDGSDDVEHELVDLIEPAAWSVWRVEPSRWC